MNVHLVEFRIAGPERKSRDHLCENATHRPHVDRRAVAPRSEKDFDGAIPSGYDFVRVDSWRHANRACKSKVRKFQRTLKKDHGQWINR